MSLRLGAFYGGFAATRRVDCRRCCGVIVEEVPWGDGKRTLTKAYMLFLAYENRPLRPLAARRYVVGYFVEFPDYLTQGETLPELEESLRDLYRDLTSAERPSMARV